MSPAVRRALKVLAIVVVALVVLAVVIDAIIPGPSGPTGSSYATAPDGLAAYADLLARSGHTVSRLRITPSHAQLDPAATLILLDPTALEPADVTALRRFVSEGGLLVAGGQDPAPWLDRLLADPPTWGATGPTTVVPLIPAPDTAGVSEVIGAGAGSWSEPHATLPLLGASGSALLTVANIGPGRVLLLADSSPLQNRYLATADNAALGLALAGAAGRRVMFEEAVHGYGQGTGLAALPVRWKWVLVGLLLAALVGVAARIRRLGPPDPHPAPALPPRRAHVDALALALARAGGTEDGVAEAAARVGVELHDGARR